MVSNSQALSGGTSLNGHAVEVIASETSYSVANNTSTVSIICRLKHTSGTPGTWGSDGIWAVAEDGEPNAKSGALSVDFRNNLFGYKDQGSGTITVEHNADGSGSVKVAAAISSNHIGAGTATVVVPLTTIPRASTATFVGGATFDAGAAVTINTNRASSSFTHTITYEFGAATGTIGTGVGASVSWTPPLSMLEQIPNTTSAAGTISVTTFNGSTKIGTTKTGYVLRASSSVKPTISSLSVSDNNPTVASIVGLFVQSLSILKATVNAAGAYGSTIKTRTFKMGSTTVNSGGVIPVTAAGSVALSASATDSRGRTGAWSGTLPVLAYATPKFNSVLVRRSNASGTVTDSGTSLRVDLNAAVSSLMNGTQRNSLTIRVFTRPRGGSVWTARNVINHTTVTYNSNFVVSGGANYPIDDSFDVKVEVSDKFKTSAAQTVIATAAVFMHWSKTGVGVGKFHERGALDVAGDIYSTNDISADRDLKATRNLNIGGTMTGGSVPNARLTELSAGLTLKNRAILPPGNDLFNITDPGFYIGEAATLNSPPGLGNVFNVFATNRYGRVTLYATRADYASVVMKANHTDNTGTAWTAWYQVHDERATPAFKTAAGIVNTPASGYVTVTLPTGFSVAPRIISDGGEQSTVSVSRVISKTSSSFQITLFSLGGAQVAGTNVNWVAVQMTTSAASG